MKTLKLTALCLLMLLISHAYCFSVTFSLVGRLPKGDLTKGTPLFSFELVSAQEPTTPTFLPNLYGGTYFSEQAAPGARNSFISVDLGTTHNTDNIYKFQVEYYGSDSDGLRYRRVTSKPFRFSSPSDGQTFTAKIILNYASNKAGNWYFYYEYTSGSDNGKKYEIPIATIERYKK